MRFTSISTMFVIAIIISIIVVMFTYSKIIKNDDIREENSRERE